MKLTSLNTSQNKDGELLLKVGILVKDKNIISMGINGTAPGADNCCDGKLSAKEYKTNNQHNNIEVTCQEQGIELYKKLQTALYVPENNEALEKEIELLCNAANSANDLKLNILAIVLSIILAIVAPFWDNGKEIISWIISFFTGTPGA